MTATECPRCGRADTGDAYICPVCTTEAVNDLTEAAPFLAWIDDKRARRSSRSWVGGSIPGVETPLPYDSRVRKVLQPIRRHLTTHARATIRHHGCTNLPNPADTLRIANLSLELAAWDVVAAKADDAQQRMVRGFRATVTDAIQERKDDANLTDLAAVATWLAEHMEWIALQPWAADLCQHAADARERLHDLFDNPPETIALGTCGHVHDTEDEGRVACSNILSAPATDAHYQCPRCSHIHDVHARRLELLQQADDLSVTVADASKLLRASGVDVSRQTVHRIVTHFGIESTSTTTGPGRPAKRYPLGAVREAALEYVSTRGTRTLVDKLDKVSATLSA